MAEEHPKLLPNRIELSQKLMSSGSTGAVHLKALAGLERILSPIKLLTHCAPRFLAAQRSGSNRARAHGKPGNRGPTSEKSPAKELVHRILAASVGRTPRAPQPSRAALLGESRDITTTFADADTSRTSAWANTFLSNTL